MSYCIIQQSPRQPKYTSAEELINYITTLFKDKVAIIHTRLDETQKNYNLDLGPETQLLPNAANLTCFDEATEKEVKEIIMASASKACSLDLIPTHMLKNCLHVLLPFSTRITNLSA